MRVGVMLRHLSQHGGGVLGYTQHLLQQWMAANSSHEFVFLYADDSHLEAYGKHDNLIEAVYKSRSKLLWDQREMLKAEKRFGFDVLFNPKYSLPLGVKCPSAFVCHGLDWYVMPWGSKLVDRISHKVLIPRYARKADGIVAVSNTPKQHLIEFLGMGEDKIRTIYLGVNEDFYSEIPESELDRIRQKYKLPSRYALYVGQIYPPKNFGRLLKAYAKVGPKQGVHLVVAGDHRWLCGPDLALIGELGISDWVVQTDWIGHEELPSFYRMADVLMLPSLYEACPSPLLEAMASDCPIVTADRHGTKEIAGNAAALVNPESVDSIAEGLKSVLESTEYSQKLIELGRTRVREFSWQKCAHETLEYLEELAQSRS